MSSAYALPSQNLKFLGLLSQKLALLPEYFLSLEAEDAQGDPKYTQYGEETCQELDIGVVQINVQTRFLLSLMGSGSVGSRPDFRSGLGTGLQLLTLCSPLLLAAFLVRLVFVQLCGEFLSFFLLFFFVLVPFLDIRLMQSPSLLYCLRLGSLLSFLGNLLL